MVPHHGPRAIIAAAVAALVIGGSVFAAPAAFATETPAGSTAQTAVPATPEEAHDAGDPTVSDPPEQQDPSSPDESDEGAGSNGDTEGDAAPAPREPEPTREKRAPQASAESAPAPVAVSLKASRTKVDEGQTLTLTATVSPATATGTVSFTEGERELADPVSVAGGEAVLAIADLEMGEHRITANFVPDDPGAYEPAASSAITVRVIGEVLVKGASLSWGVKASFRNYIYNFKAFEGRATLLGSASQPVPKGVYAWPNGAGKVRTDGSRANVQFGTRDGVHFQSHPMKVGGKSVYALDLAFTHPRIVITSPTTGELRMDVSGYEFKSTTEVGSPYTLSDARIAVLTLPSPVQRGDALVWTDAGATLTAEGEQAFGGFYHAGDALDPLTFSLSADGSIVGKKPTSVKLSASRSKASKGAKLTFTARVSPQLAGTVAFTSDGKRLGSPIAVKSGRATLSTASLPVGAHSVRASFEPKDDDTYGHSLSNIAQITVLAKQKAERAQKSSSTAAGALRWGISGRFAAYVTCANKEAYALTHCAKGSIGTSGVGGGYLFPQAATENWNRKAQTGTVRYSGSVAFSGYGMTLFQVSNPSITVTGPGSATLHTGNSTSYGSSSYRLDLSRATKTVGSRGEVTWSGVPVLGTLSSGGAGGSGAQAIGLDSLTFTVGAKSAASFGSSKTGASKPKKRTPAATPPATTGVTVLTPADRLIAGGRIEIEASGFEPNEEGVLVVLYSKPVVLDESATADASGVVRWTGKLPEDLSGEHTLTLQGSTDAGAVIDIAERESGQSVGEAGAPQIEAESVQAAGLAGPAAEGLPLWQWWASAGGLVAIAACMTLLVVRQRRMST